MLHSLIFINFKYKALNVTNYIFFSVRNYDKFIFIDILNMLMRLRSAYLWWCGWKFLQNYSVSVSCRKSYSRCNLNVSCPSAVNKIIYWHVESENMLFTALIIRQLKVRNNLFSNGFQSGILFSNQLIDNKANFMVCSLGTNFKYKSLNVTNLHIFF